MPSFKRYLMTGTAAFLSVTVLAQTGFSAQAGKDEFGQPQVVKSDKLTTSDPLNVKGATLEKAAKEGAVKAAAEAENQANKTGTGKSGDGFKGGNDKSSYEVKYDAQSQKSKDGAKVSTYSYSYKYKEQEKTEPEFHYEESQGEKFKVYTQAYSWCTAREDVQSGLSPEVRDVRVSGPKWGFSSISTVEMCYAEDFRLGFLTSKKVTSIKLVGADGKEFLLKENPIFTPKMGDPLLKGGVNPVDMKSYVFENSQTKGEDGKYFINSGSNVFKIVMEGADVEKKSVEVKINILEPYDESEECRDENELNKEMGAGGPKPGPVSGASVPGDKKPSNKTPDGKAPGDKAPDSKPKDTIPTGGSCSGGEMGTFLEDCSGGKM